MKRTPESAGTDPHDELLESGGRVRVQVVPAGDHRFGYVAQFGYDACDGPFRDRFASVETFPTELEAREAGLIKARQLAGIDVPEA